MNSFHKFLSALLIIRGRYINVVNLIVLLIKETITQNPKVRFNIFNILQSVHEIITKISDKNNALLTS